MNKHASFCIGQIVKHSLFEYRGVIIDVDPAFMLSEKWYSLMAKSQPPKDAPWYHVLVHGVEQQTYVAEQNLTACNLNLPIENPALDEYFVGFKGGRYILDKSHTN